MAGQPAGKGLVSSLLRDPGGFPPEATEVEKLGPAHPAPADDLDTLHGRGMEGEDTLDTDPGRDFPDHEGLGHAATPPTDADPLEGLDPLFLALTDAIEYPDRVPGSELGHVLAKLLLLKLTH